MHTVPFSFNLYKYLLPICPYSINLVMIFFVEQKQAAFFLNVKLFPGISLDPSIHGVMSPGPKLANSGSFRTMSVKDISKVTIPIVFYALKGVTFLGDPKGFLKLQTNIRLTSSFLLPLSGCQSMLNHWQCK